MNMRHNFHISDCDMLIDSLAVIGSSVSEVQSSAKCTVCSVLTSFRKICNLVIMITPDGCDHNYACLLLADCYLALV